MKNKIVRKKTLLAVAMLMFSCEPTVSLIASPEARTVPLEITPGINKKINLQIGGVKDSSYYTLSNEDSSFPTNNGRNDGYIAKGLTINGDYSSGVTIKDGSGNVNITLVRSVESEDPYGGDPYGGEVTNSECPILVYANEKSLVCGINAAQSEAAVSIQGIELKSNTNNRNLGDIFAVSQYTNTDSSAVVNGINAIESNKGSWCLTNTIVGSSIIGYGSANGINASKSTNNWTLIGNIIVANVNGAGTSNGISAEQSSGAWDIEKSTIFSVSKGKVDSVALNAKNSSGNWKFDNVSLISSREGALKNYAINAEGATGNLTFNGENYLCVSKIEEKSFVCDYDNNNDFGINIGGNSEYKQTMIFNKDSKTHIIGGIGNLDSATTNATVVIDKDASVHVYGDCSGVKCWNIDGSLNLEKKTDTLNVKAMNDTIAIKKLPQGTLTVGANEEVVFVTNNDGSCGSINLDGDGTSPQLSINSGAKFALDIAGDNETLPALSLVNFHVVKTPNVKTAEDIAKLISINSSTINIKATNVDGYYRIESSDGDIEYSKDLLALVNEYENISAMRLLISTRPNKCGLVMLTLIKLTNDTPITLPSSANTIDLSGYYSDDSDAGRQAVIKKESKGTLKITGSCDNFYGTLAIDNGVLEFTEAANYKGTITIAKDTQLTLAKPSSIATLRVKEGSVKLDSAGEYTFGTVSFGSTWDTMNGSTGVTTLSVDDLTMTGENNWKLKLNPEAGTSDTLNITTLNNPGYKVIITDYALIGESPQADSYELQVLTVTNGSYPKIEVPTAKELNGYKLFSSDRDGYVSLKRLFASGWASGLTDDEKSSIESGFIPTKNMNEIAYNNISTTIINVMGTTRYYEFDENGSIKGKLGYRIWNTLSGSSEKFKMNEGSSKIKNAGAEEIFGVDFAPKMFGNNWYAIPTVFIGYDHNRLKYDGQKSSQNNWLVGSKLALINNKYSFELLGMYKSIETKAKGGNSCKISSDVLSIGANVGVSFKATTNVTIKPEVLVDYSHIWMSDKNINNVKINNKNNDMWDVSPAVNFMFNMGKLKANIAPRYHQKLSNNSKSNIGSENLPNKSEKKKYFEISAELKYDNQRSFEAGLRFSEYFAGRTGCKVTLDLSKKF